MPNDKCPSCGCTEIEVDPTKGDSFCTQCGTVLEESVMVSQIQYEDNAYGGSSALGQFVAADSTGLHGFGSSFHCGSSRESRELTLQNARRSITSLAQSLRLSTNCINIAFNFYKLALGRQLTRGRKHLHVIGACVYITCRTERTVHLLIDVSDALQVSVYDLGRTYMRIAKALYINIPSMDPTIYVLRFSSCLGFGDQTHKVSETASRIVQRMMKDSIHSGRRPSGLCGAALLIAARLNNFNRTVSDIIKIVKVHESTLKKRMLEFGETPSSSLTVDEFMAVDLEEEQDPPSFRMARNQDKVKLQKMLDSELLDENFTELQQQIDKELEDRVLRSSTKKKRGMPSATTTGAAMSSIEEVDTENFIRESTIYVINECIPGNTEEQASTSQSGLGPNIDSFGLAKTINECMEIRESTRKKEQEDPPEQESESADFDDIDDDEINSYIMSESESSYKANLWNRVNAEYLKQQEEKAERLAKDKEEGKPEKKKRKTTRKKKSGAAGVASTAGEAIEKMLQEKKLSSKINYDVLKNLNFKSEMSQVKIETPPTVAKVENIVPIEKVEKTEKESTEMSLIDHESDLEDDYMEDEPPTEEPLSAVRQMAQMKQMTHSDSDEDY